MSGSTPTRPARRAQRPGYARRGLAAITAVALASLGGLAAPAAAEDPRLAAAATESPSPSKISFVIGIKQDIDSLNPYAGVVVSAFEAYQLMYDTLTGTSAADFSPEPLLAESWESSADGKTWTYHLRKGVKWSDGKDLTAKDVVYTFQRAKDDEAANSQYASFVDGISKITATDEHTVVMTRDEPSPIMERLGVPILPEHVWSKIGAKQTATFANDTKPVGSGPFALVEAKKGQFYRFTANKDYFLGAPKIDELVLNVFADDSAMAQALRTGEIDMARELPAAIAQTLERVDGITTNYASYYRFNEIGYNLGAATVDDKAIGDGHPALKDKQVRLAIDYAIDRKTLVEKVTLGHGEPATGVIPPIYGGMHWNPGDGARTFDVSTSNQILDAAGYAKGAGGVRAKDGKALKFRLFARENEESSQKTAEYVRGWLKEIGIEVVVSVMSEDNLTTAISQGEYDLFEWGWEVDPDPDFQLSVMTCDQRSYEEDGEIAGGWSDSFYCNPAYDALYAQQRTMTDAAARAEVVKKAQQLLYDDVAYSVTWYYRWFEAYRSDKFTGFVPQPAQGGVLAFQFGTHSYRSIRPVGPELVAEDAPISSTTLAIAAAGVAVLLFVVVGAVVVFRRRAGADDRE